MLHLNLISTEQKYQCLSSNQLRYLVPVASSWSPLRVRVNELIVSKLYPNCGQGAEQKQAMQYLYSLNLNKIHNR